MPTRQADDRGPRFALTAFLVCVCALSLQAQAPDAIVRRIADLNVQLAEIKNQYDTSQIDVAAFNARTAPLDAERERLRVQLQALPFETQRQADQQILSLTNARLSILLPQWQKAEQDRRDQQQARQRQAVAAIAPAARAALQVQRRRIELQQRRDRGEISAEDFAAQDKQAVDDIAAIRQKYIAEYGDKFIANFDNNLQFETEKLLKAPPARAPGAASRTAPPRPSVRPFSGPPATSPMPVASGLGLPQLLSLLLLGGVAIGAYQLLRRRRPAGGPAVSNAYGSAYFEPMATQADADCVRQGVFLGKSSRPDWRTSPNELVLGGAPICTTPEAHTLIVAPTRTGKGTRVIVPTLLRYAGSALVIDPKGENAAVTARSRRTSGQTVHVLNPWEELADTYRNAGFAAAAYNPLDCIDRSDRNAVAVAQGLAEAVCPTASDKKDQFWQGSAANILAATFLWLADQPGEKKTLARAREITSLSRKDFTTNYLARMATSSGFDGAIRELSAQFVDMPHETYGGVMAALSQSMKFLSDPQIKEATATSSFSMADLITAKTTVYVVIPPDRIDTQKTWLRLLLAAGMHTFRRFTGKRPGHRCLFLIDEFASLGRIDNLPKDIATMSGHGLDLALVVQGLDQIKDHYGEARGTILSNCAYKWFSNVRDLDTAKWLSEALGKATIQTVSRSESHSASTKSKTEGNSTTYAETGRALFNPDEIMNLGKDAAIALQPFGHAHFLLPVDYWALDAAFASFEKTNPRLFWNPPLAYDPNPYAQAVTSA